MQNHFSYILKYFQDLYHLKYPPSELNKGHDPNRGNHTDAQQGDEEGAMDRTNPEKLSAVGSTSCSRRAMLDKIA